MTNPDFFYNPPRVAIVILTCNQRDLTMQCLDAVVSLSYPPNRLQVLVVDNGSDDGTEQAIRGAHPTVIVLQTGENLGYAGGNNFGIHHALGGGADYILILNNDALVAPDLLSELVTVAERAPRAGFVGPKVYHQEEPNRIQTTGITLDHLFDSRHRGADELDNGQFETIREFDAVTGCAMLVSRGVVGQVGLLDPRFFIYHEEVDWCLRAKAAGYRNLYVPTALVWHRRPRPSSEITAFTAYYMTRNRYLLLSKHKAGLSAFALTLKRDLVWLLNWSLNPKWRHNRERRNALLKAIVDAVLRRYGRRRYRYGR